MQSEVKRYKVAGHIFEVIAGSESAAVLFPLMDNYAPFEIEGADSCAFAVEVSAEACDEKFVEEIRQDDEGQEIVCGKIPDGRSIFVFYLGDKKAGSLICEGDFKKSKLYVGDSVRLQRFALNNALMVMYALATSCNDTALFHSAVVTRDGLGYMFLGVSGTGKSTHARMWLGRFKDAELLNDDNPVVRLELDGAYVYGSPWSGKTPCYKNQRVKIAGIIDLSQAPHNRIFPIQGIEAYMALTASISGMRWNKKMADGLHATENRLAQEVKMFHLECLPNENAAEVCCEAFEK